MKIYSIIIDETDTTPCLFQKSFSSYSEAEKELVELGKETAEYHGGEFSVEDYCVYKNDFPVVNYSIEWSEI